MGENPTKVAKGGGNTAKLHGKGAKIMFHGEFSHNVDTKNRLFVPARIRLEIGKTFVVSQSLRGNYLKICSPEEWDRYVAPIKEMDRRFSEPLLRYLYGHSAELEADAQGRIIIPSEMLKFAQISKETVIVGCGDYAEIWSAELYRRNDEDMDMGALIKALEDVGL